MNHDEDNELPEGEENSEEFSDNPEEQLKIENELLRLKLQAETGADIHQMSDVPPEVENAFLNNIIAFERQLDSLEEQSVYEILGKPDFKPVESLSADEVVAALDELEELMKQNGMEVGFGMDYPAEVKYKFITEELFQHQTQKFDIPDMTHHFSYEEFHPNHLLSVQNLATEFIEMWLAREIEPETWELAEQWKAEDGRILNRKEVVLRMQHVFDAFLSFTEGSFNINELDVEDPDETNDKVAHARVKGKISYHAEFENKDVQEVDENFTLHMQFHSGSWEICNAVMPGFIL